MNQPNGVPVCPRDSTSRYTVTALPDNLRAPASILSSTVPNTAGLSREGSVLALLNAALEIVDGSVEHLRDDGGDENNDEGNKNHQLSSGPAPHKQ